jgi:glutamate 5-kinase
MNDQAQAQAEAEVTGLASARRIIVKIGSALLVDHERGTLHRQWLEGLAADLADLRDRGQEVIIVSSGAIAVGRRYLGLADGDLRLEEMQAAAAAGMVRLAHAYQETLAGFDLTVAQVLLTLDDSENRRRYLNARNTLDTLLRLGAVPLINENDTVATDEIRFGDNDRLAGRVAAMISADTLVLLSDIDGLYAADPRHDPDARRLDVVREITPEIEAMAGQAKPGYGRGGMVTKLAAAKACLAAGCRMIIADGTADRPISRLEDGAPCTWFLPSATPKTARKRWIAGTLMPVGSITVDAGAAKALTQGRSLLPAGVTAVDGTFERGDAVVVKDVDGRELGRGLVAYAADDARQIIGRRSGDIESVLGFHGRDEMIHRDDLVLG